MTLARTPYDDYPYRSYPVEWSAPERLALASLLHGGPRLRVDDPYRVLEVGCGDGTNLIALASGRPHARFVGIDAAASQVDIATARQAASRIRNLEFVAADIRAAGDCLEGEFDFILAHGVFSWISPDVRRAFLELCGARLRRGGLLYLNYNAKPGWNVRGLVREFLLAQTVAVPDLRRRTALARDLAAKMADRMDGGDHPFSQLLAREFRFVGETDASYTAHEYLSPDNWAFTKSEFDGLAATHHLFHVAEADFDRSSGRLPEGLPALLDALGIADATRDEVADLVCYRQLRSPVLTKGAFTPCAMTVSELAGLSVSAPLRERGDARNDGLVVFEHPSGREVEARSGEMAHALRTLAETWPIGTKVGALFQDVTQVADDLLLLHKLGLVEMRLDTQSDPPEPGLSSPSQ